MATYSNEQLESMGLEASQGANHEFVNYSNWATKTLMHTAIKGSTIQPKKPGVARMWRQAQGSTVISSVYCNMGIYILKVSCIVVKGGANDVDKALADEFFLCKEEMGVWTLKYLTVSEGSHKNNVHLKQASPSETYAVKDYNKYIPTKVMESVEKYKTLYYTKYKPDNAKLTMAMITTS